MPKRKTWVWILVSIAGVGFIVIVGVAIAGIVFVSRHVTTTHASAADAERAFDAAKAHFKDSRPLIELDQAERPLRLLGRDQVERPLLVVLAPATPVREALHPFQELILGWAARAGCRHGDALLRWSRSG